MQAIHDGKSIGCQVPPVQPGRLAWVDVFARVDRQKGVITRNNPEGKLEIAWFGSEDPVCGYSVRHVEIDRAYEQYIFFDYDLYAEINDLSEFETQNLLEQHLTHLGVDFASLKIFRDFISEWVISKQESQHEGAPVTESNS